MELFEPHIWSTLPLELVGEEVLIQELDEGDLFISWTKKFCQCTKQTMPTKSPTAPKQMATSTHSLSIPTPKKTTATTHSVLRRRRNPSTDQALSPNLQGVHQPKQPLGTATKPWWRRHMEVDEIPSPTRTFKQLQYEERIVNVDRGSFCPLVFSTSGAIAPPSTRFFQRQMLQHRHRHKYDFVEEFNELLSRNEMPSRLTTDEDSMLRLEERFARASMHVVALYKKDQRWQVHGIIELDQQTGVFLERRLRCSQGASGENQS